MNRCADFVKNRCRRKADSAHGGSVEKLLEHERRLVSHGGMKTFRFPRIASIGLIAPVLLVATASFGENTMTSASNQYIVYFGTYTAAKSKGIYVSRFDATTGKLGAPELAAETKNPSFVAVHPSHRFLYAVGEIASVGGKKGGAISAFAIDAATGKLTLLNQQSTVGPGPCHVSVDNAGKNAFAANYGGGSVAVLPIKKDGSLSKASAFVQHTGSSVNPKRQAGPHAHAINLDAANRFVFVPDLGLDKVMIYRLDAAKGTLTPNEPAFGTVPPGSGPRHIAFHPNGRFAYVINEMLCTMTTFSYDATRGELKELQTLSTLPAGESVQPGYSTAEVLAHPSGKFVYGSNRGHDTIAIFAVDPQTGKLAPVGHESTQGKAPRCFGIDPTGAYLLAANQGTDNVVVFRIDQKSGKLTATGQSIEVGAPVCVMFMPVK